MKRRDRDQLASVNLNWDLGRRQRRVLCALLALVIAVVSAFNFCSGSSVKAAKDGQDTELAAGEGRKVRVGYYTDKESFQYGYGDEDRKTGYAYDYYQEIAKYTGWNYEYVYGTWNEIYEKLLSGEVDLMAGITRLEERFSDMLFPDYSMGGETYYLYVSEESDISAYDVSVLNGAKIGVRENSTMRQLLQDFLDDQGISCEIISYVSLEERMEELDNGKLDYVMTVENDMVAGYKPKFKIGSSDFYLAVSKSRPDLLNELNEAQEEIMANSPYYVSRLQDKYFNTGTVKQNLTEKEREWLSERQTLKVGYLKEYMPYCDSGTKSGEIRGILPELLSELSDYMGVEFVCNGYENYDRMLQALKEEEIDLIFPTFEDLWYSENQNYMQTVPVASAQMCVVYEGDYEESLYKRIAVSDGSPLQPFFVSINYPEAEQVTYDTWHDCLLAIRKGEVGCMLVNSNLIYRYMNEHEEFSDLHIAELEALVYFCFAVRRSDSVLYTALNKGLNSIDGTRINDAVIRNSHVEPKYTLRYFVIHNMRLAALIVTGFILILFLFFLLYWNRVKRERRLQEEAYEQEKRFYADKEEKYNIIGSLSRIYDYTYYINMEDQIYQTIKDLDFKDENFQSMTEAKEEIENRINLSVKEKYRERLKHFVDLSTLEERLRSAANISIEYETEQNGWFRGSFIPVGKNAQGRLTYVIYAIQEINEEKEAQEQAQQALEDAYEAANRANHAKSDFLARMSHDIRTPMNAIIGMTAIAATHIDDRDRVADCLKKITSSGKHLLTLINEVLDMSKIESGKLEIIEEEFNLQELVDNMVTMIQPQVDAKRQSLQVSVKGLEHEDLVGDALHIQQIFVNIMGNAVKYTPEGGTLQFFVTEKPIRKPKIGCYEFVFEDNGIGMSQEFIGRIFEPFAREDESRSNQVQGTGLGLSIVANIVKMMAGDIKVESEQGKGSKFTVTLYLKFQEEQEISFADFVELPVLVVDDQQEACESTCMILQDLGMKSEWVTSGREAVEKVQSSDSYFAIILDWKMPEMDGLETAREIRRIDGGSIPIIILSGYDWPEIENQAKEVGVNAFVSKPLFKSRLNYLFKRLINGDGAESKNPLEQLGKDAFAGKRILLAEDNEINAEIAQEIFSMVGLTVEHAKDGREAVDMATASEPGYYDMIFMDIQMPFMNGYEATHSIRVSGREDLEKIPIIAMTANAFAEDVRTAIQAGMNQHIAKPLDLDRIMEVLKTYLQGTEKEMTVQG